MSEVTTIGLDLAKHVFQVHGVDAAGGVRSAQTAAARPGGGVFRGCRAAWSGWRRAPRRITGRGNYRRWATVGRPSMRFVAIKTAQQQAALLLHRGRERLVRQRTGLVN